MGVIENLRIWTDCDVLGAIFEVFDTLSHAIFDHMYYVFLYFIFYQNRLQWHEDGIRVAATQYLLLG